METATSIPGYVLREATEEDVPLVLSFIRGLAEYEKIAHKVTATEDLLRESLFGDRKSAEVILGYYRDEPVAFALFYHTYSTHLGRPGLFLEDLFVKPAMRKKGFGKALLSYLARLARERNCRRFEWCVLDWNEPDLKFYRSIGAVTLDDWTVHRLEGEALKKLSDEL